ncbi:MAG: hypothetical protein ABIG42_10940 [bacterium]
MNRKYWKSPLFRGTFFVPLLVIFAALFLVIGCTSNPAPAPAPAVEEKVKDDKFILMVSSEPVLKKSVQLLKECPDYKSSESELFNLMTFENDNFPVKLEISDAYGCAYPDGRKVVFYPVSELRLPEEDEIRPLGFLHYFDENQMNVFFQVITSCSSKNEVGQGYDGVLSGSRYKIFILSKEGKRFGLPGSRILDKSDLTEEEAFRKFNASSRRVLIGTNSLDRNKFLFIFLKIQGLEDQIFQIFHHWY